jgi:hypothetical protein
MVQLLSVQRTKNIVYFLLSVSITGRSTLILHLVFYIYFYLCFLFASVMLGDFKRESCKVDLKKNSVIFDECKHTYTDCE